MKNNKELFLDKNIRMGGFFELCIEVCSSTETEPIQKYLNYIWNLSLTEGPFDDNFNKTSINIENYRHAGILNFKDKPIPFNVFNIREESPIKTGSNWLDISFYTSTIERVFGDEFITWSEPKVVPQEINDFFNKIMKDLYNIFPFRIAMIDYEVSGQYYLEDLKAKKIERMFSPTFFIGKENLNVIREDNKRFIQVINL